MARLRIHPKTWWVLWPLSTLWTFRCNTMEVQGQRSNIWRLSSCAKRWVRRLTWLSTDIWLLLWEKRSMAVRRRGRPLGRATGLLWDYGRRKLEEQKPNWKLFWLLMLKKTRTSILAIKGELRRISVLCCMQGGWGKGRVAQYVHSLRSFQ